MTDDLDYYDNLLDDDLAAEIEAILAEQNAWLFGEIDHLLAEMAAEAEAITNDLDEIDVLNS